MTCYLSLLAMRMGSQVNPFNYETPELMKIIPKTIIVQRVRTEVLMVAGINR